MRALLDLSLTPVLLGLVLSLTACKPDKPVDRPSTGDADTDVDTDDTDVVDTDDTDVVDTDTDDTDTVPDTAGTISGSIDGVPLDTIASAWYIGASADPEAEAVMFLFSAPTECAAISTEAWDETILDGTKVIEIHTMGLAPAAYVVKDRPDDGEAGAMFVTSSLTDTPSEMSADGGTITLTTLTPATAAAGTFTLEFGSDSVTGDFNAGWCPTGVER